MFKWLINLIAPPIPPHKLLPARSPASQKPAYKITRAMLEKSRDDSLHYMNLRKERGDPGWWGLGVEAIRNDLEIAVAFHSGIPEACDYLRSRDLPKFLAMLPPHIQREQDNRLAQKLPGPNDVYRYCLFACAAWLLGEDAIAQQWLDRGNHPCVLLMRDRFDEALMNAYLAFAAKTPHTITYMRKFKGWENNLMRYAQLAAAFTRAEDVAPHIAEIKKHYDRRNRTYESMDNYGILDGQKTCPSSFDIHLEGILAFARRHYDFDPKKKGPDLSDQSPS